MNYKNGDIVRWSYTSEKIDKMGGRDLTTYWRSSQIAIYNDGRFVDTYWHSSSSNKSFSEDELSISPEVVSSEIYHVDFIANIDDLIECRKTEFSYYENSDCVNISHPNNTRSGFYIRKNSTKSLEKMRHVITAHIGHYTSLEDNAKRQVEILEKDLENLTIESFLPCNPDVYI